MAFGVCIFIVAILLSRIGAQSTQSIQPTHGTSVSKTSSSQAEDDKSPVYASTIVAFTDTLGTLDENEYNLTVATDVPISWNNTTMSTKEHMEVEVETTEFVSSVTPLESINFTLDSSEELLTYMTDKLETNTNHIHTLDASISSTQTQQIDIDEPVNETEIVTAEDTNVTTSSDQWSIKNSSRESRRLTTDATDEQEYKLIMLKSNCSIVNSENVPLSEDLSDVGCTIELRVNLPSENATRDKLLRTLEKLNIKPDEFQVVEMYKQNEDASGHKQQDNHSGFVFDPETFAYLAVAVSFAFLLLLAIMVFGFRCFKKRRPSLDISRFDVRLSNYTLTKIPRASLSAMDSLHESDTMDDKPESSTVRNKSCGSCESGLDIITCDTFSSNREMKTFGVSRPSVSRNNDSPTDMYPQHNPIAYENHTFQRYF